MDSKLQATLDDLNQQLKLASGKKGEVSSQFKHVAKGSTEHQVLLQKMKTVTEKIKELESQLKKCRDSFLANETAQAEPAPTLPRIINRPFKGDWGFPFKILALEDNQLSAWSSFLEESEASVYQRKPWLDIIEKSFRHKSVTFLALDESNRILGCISITYFHSKIFGQFAVSIPFINYGGPVTPYGNIARALVAHCESLVEVGALKHIEVRATQPNLHQNCFNKKASMILQLPATDEELDIALGAKVRAQYKKAEAYKPEFKVGGVELLDDFYYVFAINMRDLGTPVYSKTFFSNILNSNDVQATVVVVYVEKRPVACGFLIANQDMLEIPWASTLKCANPMNINMWMYRQILSLAIERKYEFFDFGRSTIDAGTYRFKKQWGAAPHQHHWYYLSVDTYDANRLTTDNPKLKLIIAIWQRLPVWLTKLVGPYIVRDIP